jgi:hypothetical protein
MKSIAMVVMMLGLSASTVYAHDRPLKMSFSGTAGASAFNLQVPNSNTGEDNLAGNGPLGAFTFRGLSAQSMTPDPSGTCPSATQTYIPETFGGGVFRFEDGSLLKVNLIKGYDCIDFTSFTTPAHCVFTFQVTGGTGRFANASGELTFTESVLPALLDALNNPIFFAKSGEITGSLSGVGWAKDAPEPPQ